MDKKTLLYEQILKVLNRGSDVEVRLKNGEPVVYEVQRRKAVNTNKPLLNGQ